MNVMQMLVNQSSLSMGDGAGGIVGEHTLSGNEQQFRQVLAQLVVPSVPIPTINTEGEEELALQFQNQLGELLSLLDEANDGAEFLVNIAGQHETSNDASVIEEEADGLAELMLYLDRFAQALAQDNLSTEELYFLFAAIPQLPAEVTLPIGTNEATVIGNGLLHNQGTQPETQHWTRWTMLLEQIQQALQDKSPIQGPEQLKQAMVSLVTKLNDHPKWLAILQQKMGKDLGTIESVLAHSTTKQDKPVFTTYLPLSLLTQTKHDSGLERQTPANQLHNNSITNQETHSATSQTTSLVGSEARELTAEGTGRLANLTKPSESTSLPNARMTHFLEDMQGVFRKQISLLKDGDLAQLRVRLTPEHLGHLDIRITSENGKVIAQIMTSTKLAKDALELQLHQLRATLVQQGIQVERMEVSQQTGSNNLLHQEHRGAQHFQQQQGQKGTAKQAEYTEVDELENNEGVFYEQESQVNYAV